MSIHPVLIHRFDQAVKLAQSGEYQKALDAYAHILDASPNSSSPRDVTGEFLARVELGKIYCLMDLGRYAEARTLCETEQMQDILLSQLDMSDVYAYYVSYGNILGHLGQTTEMDRAMTAALTLAAEELSDLERCEQVWRRILHWGREHQQWDYLLDQCKLAHQFGINSESYLLQQLAGELLLFNPSGSVFTERVSESIYKGEYDD